MRATFFVLGVAALEHPACVRRIADAGHELGTHGWAHTPLYRQSRAQFGAELHRSLDTLQDLTRRRVRGHRAAMFSVTARSTWALEVLAQAGLTYDSSIFPVHNYRYGMPGAQRFPHLLCRQPDLWEFPISTLRAGGVNLPVGGGFYARFWPRALLRWAVARFNHAGQPAVFYFHPWEFDPAQPRLRSEARRLARATHYYRLASARETLYTLLAAFDWGAVEDVMPQVLT